MRLETVARRIYVATIRPRLTNPLTRQRVKTLWHGWSYLGLLRLRHLSFAGRLALIRRFLKVDWKVLHAHAAYEVVEICSAVANRPARAGEVMVQAGCWQGGSSVKFSIICKALGYRLWIFDSFEGVEPMTDSEGKQGFDFSGAFSSPEPVLRRHLQGFGEPSVCTIVPGWFVDTLAWRPLPHPIKVGYIDCDLVKGTKEALSGIVPSLTSDGVVFSQDCHISRVFDTLHESKTWAELDCATPTIERLGRRLVSLRFSDAAAAASARRQPRRSGHTHDAATFGFVSLAFWLAELVRGGGAAILSAA